MWRFEQERFFTDENKKQEPEAEIVISFLVKQQKTSDI